MNREPGPLRLGGREFGPHQRLVLAIVNRTLDSFYRPGITWDEGAAMERVDVIVAEGADILDVGGVPAKPGAEITVEKESRRVVPFIEVVRAAYPDLCRPCARSPRPGRRSTWSPRFRATSRLPAWSGGWRERAKGRGGAWTEWSDRGPRERSEGSRRL